MTQVSHEAESRAFFAGAQVRALRIGSFLSVVAIAIGFGRWGTPVGLALLIGILVGGLNTFWLARSTAAFARRAAESADPDREAQRPGSGGVLFQYVFRYLLIALAAYAIFKSSIFNVLGFFAGLFLPVLSLMVEALYEAWVSHRRGL